jgi:hypothetical protein
LLFYWLLFTSHDALANQGSPGKRKASDPLGGAADQSGGAAKKKTHQATLNFGAKNAPPKPDDDDDDFQTIQACCIFTV